MEDAGRVLPPQMLRGWREGDRGELGRIRVGPSHIKHRVLGLALCLARMAVVGEPVDVGHNAALRRRGAFRFFLFRAICRSYMERRGKGVWTV